VNAETGDVTGANFTNTYTRSGKISISGSKTWTDYSDADETRPESLTIGLYKVVSVDSEDEPSVDTTEEKVELQTTNADADNYLLWDIPQNGDTWTYTIANVEKYDENGNQIIYKVKESSPSDYKATETEISGNVDSNGNITEANFINTYTRSGKISISGSKMWIDYSNAEGKRPENLTVVLYKVTESINEDGVEVTETAVQLQENDEDAENYLSWNIPEDKDEWTYTITNVEKYDADGNQIVYKVKETSPEGYTAMNREASGIVDSESGNVTEANFINYMVRITISKLDLSTDNPLAGATLKIVDKSTKEVIDEWTSVTTAHTIRGKLLIGHTYTLSEVSAPTGYKTADPIEFTIKEDGTIDEVTNNTITMKDETETIEISGTKIWDDADNQDGIRPESIEVKLQKKASSDEDWTDVADSMQTVKAAEDGTWTYSWKNLPKMEDGQEIQYQVVEISTLPSGYSVSGGTAKEQYNLKNSYTPETIQKTVTKVWDDGNNKDSLRPTEVQVQLYAGNDAYGTAVTLNEQNEWTYTWTELPKYSQGTEIEYSVKEVEVTDGYTVSYASNSDGFTVTNKHVSGSLTLEAKKSLTGATLKAGEFTFLLTEIDENGEAIEADVTASNDAGGAITFPTLTYNEAGTHYYQITEVNDGRSGYSYDSSVYTVTVTVEDDHAGALQTAITAITRDGVALDTDAGVIFINAYSASTDVTLKAAKAMKNADTALGTFQFELKDASGNVLQTVTNDAEGAITFGKLTYDQNDAGRTFTYTVSEKQPTTADAYIYDETVYAVTVSVSDNGNGTLSAVTTVDGAPYTDETMKFVNDTTSVTFNKTDAATDALLAGAVLKIVDKSSGATVDQWTSDGQTAHTIQGKLATGQTYTMVEVSAPDGYEVAASIDFTVQADGTVSDVADNTIVMKDKEAVDDHASVTVTKRLKLSDGSVIAARNQTFYVALFSDEACTQRVTNVKAIHFQDTIVSSVTFTGLEKDRTYYVGETDADGNVTVQGEVATGELFYADFSEGSKVVTEAGGTTTISFDNEFFTLPSGFYKEGELTITKKLIGADGKAKSGNETFYAGIFDDAAHTVLSDSVSQNIVELALGGAAEATSETVYVAFPEGGSKTLYVTEVDAQGNPVAGAADFAYEVSVDKTSVTFDENSGPKTVTITNKEQGETETETETEAATEKQTEAAKSVKTGDETPIALYTTLLLAAAFVLLMGEKRRRRGER
jgi:pilin isopeptide linkage protein